MGCMVLNTFLLQNPHLKISGVIFGSPFFELSEAFGFDAGKKLAVQLMRPVLETFVVSGAPKLHKIFQNMAYKRRQLMQRKCMPLIDVNGICSFLEGIDNLQKNAEHFVYPFTMMQGDLDDVVSNPGALIWYKNAKGVKPEDKSKVMFKGATHELHTEPQPLKANVLKHAMAFMVKRMGLPRE